MSKPSNSKTDVYHLRIEMLGIKPLIWRRLWVSGNTKLPKLHRILQAVMGWENCHLHQFHVGSWLYGIPDPDGLYDFENFRSEMSVTLKMIAPERGASFVYEYDFGDGWEHQVTVEKIVPVDEQNFWPMCVAGERAAPPEDVGGAGGFMDFVEAIRNPLHQDHRQVWAWNGGPFDPNGFDLNLINKLLTKLK
jgi:hypothetical protein